MGGVLHGESLAEGAPKKPGRPRPGVEGRKITGCHTCPCSRFLSPGMPPDPSSSRAPEWSMAVSPCAGIGTPPHHDTPHRDIATSLCTSSPSRTRRTAWARTRLGGLSLTVNLAIGVVHQGLDLLPTDLDLLLGSVAGAYHRPSWPSLTPIPTGDTCPLPARHLGRTGDARKPLTTDVAKRENRAELPLDRL